MKQETVNEFQRLGGFVLAGGCSKSMKQVAQMIRAARDYRWVGVYKVTKREFVILAASDDEPPAYPRFPITQGLCGAALESREVIVVGDVRADTRYLPTFHTTRSEIIVPMMNGHGHIVGMLDAESEKVDAFGDEDREFLERAAGLIAHCLV
jgi:L-methionine (R)-S-oxide reductase